jgi:hypothetical protein
VGKLARASYGDPAVCRIDAIDVLQAARWLMDPPAGMMLLLRVVWLGWG